ncbi:MAG TPA: hypothetical protein DHU96_11435, partial [Actinobacteria bacterium]|nr:hypothetical protein [Actinomycetota bacterium]
MQAWVTGGQDSLGPPDGLIGQRGDRQPPLDGSDPQAIADLVQVTDPEKGRPGVVGSDPMGSHQLIIEAKFWAVLTAKQPGGYLTMLSPGKPRGCCVTQNQ